MAAATPIAPTRTKLVDAQEVRRAYDMLATPGQVVEIRALEASTQLNSRYLETLGGYFDNFTDLLSEIATIKQAMGIYITLQPCHPDILHRAKNKLVRQKKDSSTSDKNIIGYRWLAIDCDPERVSGISSTNKEHEKALAMCRKVRESLRAIGWPDPVVADSGNGGHLLYRIDLQTEDSQLVKRVLGGLQRFNESDVHVDLTLFNPSRIIKLYGTLACKGDNTDERPHRLSRILEVPGQMQIVSHEMLEAIAVPVEQAQPKKNSAPQPKKNGATKPTNGYWTLDEWKTWVNKYLDVIEEYEDCFDVTCPWSDQHTTSGDCMRIWYGPPHTINCFHSHCAGRVWDDIRQEHDPKEPWVDYTTHGESDETAMPYGEIEAQVLAAIESQDVTQIYRLTKQIAMLSTQEQANVGSIINRNKKTLDGYSQRDFNNCLKEAKIKRQEKERAERINKVKEGAEFRALIDIGNVASRELRSECIRALMQLNDPPSLFVQSNELCRVLHEKYKREDIDGKEREYSRSYIERHTDISLLNRLIDVADFAVIDGKGNTKHKMPETRLASLVLAHDEKPYPHITGTTSIPILRPSGEISTAQGYDKRSHLWYAPSDDLADLHIPEHPSKEDALESVDVIDDILHDFRFASKKDRTHTFAALLTTMLRPIVRNVPLCNVDAPMQGTGKSLLCTIIVMIATLGAYANLIAPQSNPKYPAEAEEEWRKAILANLMRGYPIVVIDNLPRGSKFSCAALDSALTKSEFTGRILGQSNMITVPSRAIWICNGNNITMVGDTARRTYHIRLDARSSKPWTRDNFRYSSIIDTTRDKRADIITALLTIVRAWFVAGKPSATNGVRMGSFEEWSDVLGGILDFIGMEGFLSDLQEQSDEGQGDDEWIPFMEAWHEQFPNEEHTQKELHAWFSGKIIYPGKQPMNELLPGRLKDCLEESETKFKNALQKALKKMNDVCFGQKNIRLEIRFNKSLSQDTWKVCVLDVKQESEHSGAFRSTYSDSRNSSGCASEARSEHFSGAPEENFTTHMRKNIFSQENNEENNKFFIYGNKDRSGTPDEIPITPHEEPVRRYSEHQNHILRNAPECSDTSNLCPDANSASISDEYHDLFNDYCKKIDSLAVSTPIWRATDNGHTPEPMVKEAHKKRTWSLLRSGEHHKIKAAKEAMERTLDIYGKG